MAQKTSTHTITTPVGVARWCRLNTPDTKFEEKYGSYRCELILTEDEWKAFGLQIKPMYDEAFRAECEKQGKPMKGKNKVKEHTDQNPSPIRIDDENNHLLSTKMKGGGQRKDGTEYTLSVGRFDATGAPMNGDTIIGGGSKIKLAIRSKFWFVPALGFGMTLEPHAVQVIELSSIGAGEGNAEKFGFSAVEGGYAHGGETFEDTLDKDDDGEEIQANF